MVWESQLWESELSTSHPSLWVLGSHEQPPYFGGTSGTEVSVSQAESIPPQQGVQEPPPLTLPPAPVPWDWVAPGSHSHSSFGSFPLWIHHCPMSGALSQVGLHKLPISPITPLLFCNQPVGWTVLWWWWRIQAQHPMIPLKRLELPAVPGPALLSLL